jgi:uncharacterized delta-60 repeat protein
MNMRIEHQTQTPATGRPFRSLAIALGAWLLLGDAAQAGPKELWNTVISGSGGVTDQPAFKVLAVDNVGNSYITGQIDGSTVLPTTGAAFLAKLDPSGTVLWSTSLTGATTSANNQFNGAIVDASGNVIVTGQLQNAVGSRNLVVAKYDSSGNPSATWPDVGHGVGIRQVGDNPIRFYVGYRLLLDPSGDVVISGRGASEGLLVRYTPSGNLSPAWTAPTGMRTFFVAGNVYGNDTFIARDFAGNYVFATTTNLGGSPGMGTGYDFVAVKYNSAGTQQWVANYSVDGSSTTSDLLTDIAMDSSGNLYMAGHSPGSGGNDHMAVAKINTSGALVWDFRGGGGSGGEALEVDALGKVYVAGYDDSNGMVVWKLNSSGDLAGSWPAGGGQALGKRRLGFTNQEAAVDLSLTPAGDLYVFGITRPSSAALTAWRLNAANGTTNWAEFNLDASSFDAARAIKVGPGGHIIATGFNATQDIIVLRYTP